MDNQKNADAAGDRNDQPYSSNDSKKKQSGPSGAKNAGNNDTGGIAGTKERDSLSVAGPNSSSKDQSRQKLSKPSGNGLEEADEEDGEESDNESDDSEADTDQSDEAGNQKL